MTGREDEAQQIVADVVVERGGQVVLGTHLAGFQLDAQLRVLALQHLAPAQLIDRPVLGGGHEPGARVVRDARRRPPLQRGDEGVLGEILGQTHVAHDPRQPGDEAGGLDPPHRLDRAMGVRGHGAKNVMGRTSHSPSHDGQCSLCSRMKASAPSTAFSREAHSSTA